ncbi:MAG: hypothetical protein ABI604_11645 [Nitrospirota bacterium]
MATHNHEARLSHSVAGTEHEQKVGNIDASHASAVISTTANSPERRGEARIDDRSLCSYEVVEAIGEESVVIAQGKAIALNRSAEGVLLFLRQAPHAKQLIEVHMPGFGLGRTVNVFDVRWIRPVQVKSLGNLYLVGCRRMFGPCHYLSF